MPSKFRAQSLVETRTTKDEREIEMTFVDTGGRRHTICLPAAVAADLAPVLRALAASVRCSNKTQFTRMPKQTAVGSARHERLVLIRFDDEPPYGLDIEEAENLWRGLREEAETISGSRVPLPQ